MLKKISPLLVLLPGIFYLWSNAQWSASLSKAALRFNDYAAPLADFKSALIFVGLGLLCMASFAAPAESRLPRKRFWLAGFGSLLAFSALTILLINPHGRFFWNTHDEYIEIETRARKLDLYRALPDAPQVVMLGSSVSFLAPAEYYRERWGASAFNLSVNGGGAADFLALLHSIKRIRADGQMPALVTMEFLNPSLVSPTITQTPLAYIRDIQSIPDQAQTYGDTAKSLLQSESLWDAYFIETVVEDNRWRLPLTLTEDGTMQEDEPLQKEKAYLKAVKKNVVLLDELLQCDEVDKRGVQNMEALVAFARENHIRLLLYRAPINADFYALSGYAPEKYAACAQAFNAFMQDLAAKNNHITFKDLSALGSVSRGGMAFYRDTHHLTAAGSRAMLDALTR